MDGFIISSVVMIAVCCSPLAEGKSYHIHHTKDIDGSNKCTNTFTINGEGIKDSIVSTSCRAIMDVDSLAEGVLVVGDYKMESTNVYSNQPGTMMVIAADTKKCQLRVYDATKVTKDMTDADCDYVKSQVEKALVRYAVKRGEYTDQNFGRKPTWGSVFASLMAKLTKRKPVVISNNDDNIFLLTSEPPLDKNGQCKEIMELERKELSYHNTLGDCRTDRKPRVVFFPGGVIIGDYRTDEISWISDGKGILVEIINKICTKSTFCESDLGQWETCNTYQLHYTICADYMNKMNTILGPL